MNARALLLSILSGAFASGLAYAVWYKVLPRLDAWKAGVLQLLTPVLAALGAVLILGENLPTRVLWAAGLVLLGLYFSLKRLPPKAAFEIITAAKSRSSKSV